jgi:hypothetical protein
MNLQRIKTAASRAAREEAFRSGLDKANYKALTAISRERQNFKLERRNFKLERRNFKLPR